MFQVSHGASFLQKPFAEPFLGGDIGVHDLDSHVAVQGEIMTQEYRTHAAFSE